MSDYLFGAGFDVQNQPQNMQHYYEQCFQSLNNELVQIHKRNAELAARISQLEKHIHYPHSLGQDVAMKEAAARAHVDSQKSNPEEIDYKAAYAKDMDRRLGLDKVPMRSDVETILTLKAFVESISNTGKQRYIVPQAVNDMADEALGRVK
jgi:cell division protein FtsB